MNDKANTTSHQAHVASAARAFMELFVVDNGEDRGLSLDHIDMMELTHLFVALDDAIKMGDSENG